VSSVLLDTHAWAWSLTGDDRLSASAIEAILNAESIFISPVSFFEIGQKVRIGKWPSMEPFVERLSALLEQQGGVVAPLAPQICLQAALMQWQHRDPFDRLLAATALTMSVPMISADQTFDSLPELTRIW